MAVVMYSYLNFFVVLLSLNIVTCSSNSDGEFDNKAISKLVSGLSALTGGQGDGVESLLGSALEGLDLGSGSSSSSEMVQSDLDSKEIKKYFNTMAKKEEKYYKKAMQDQISEEEKNQLKYYENLLTQIKSLNV
ncbi:uncharacterized protein LOC118273369 [Spodoptera frugiperda]|uniref:Uncharacterized protein LOC118273369 n=1 Tax=Spodoptera frugiperda TaxID=7108 RepID=A0A9R0EVS2_SPOFR|nr:uncharacterized protein LOC118273369 [Spodoptera frugiperda]